MPSRLPINITFSDDWPSSCLLIIFMKINFFCFSKGIMQPTGIAFVCLLLLASRAAGHAIGENRGEDYDDSTGISTDRKRDEAHQPRALDMESIFAGFAKSMISRTGSTSSQV